MRAVREVDDGSTANLVTRLSKLGLGYQGSRAAICSTPCSDRTREALGGPQTTEYNLVFEVLPLSRRVRFA